MKITVAFFGIPRCTAVCAPAIERHVLAPLRAVADVRVVHHLWQLERVTSARSGEDVVQPESAYDWFRAHAGRIEPPPRLEDGERFRRWTSHGDGFDDGFRSLRNLLHQLESLRRVTRLVDEQPCDAVLFARPDLLYHDPIPASACRLAQRRPHACIVPSWNWWAGLNDRFALCGARSYRAYGERVEAAEEFAARTRQPVHSEKLLRFAMRRAGASIFTLPCRASRVRADGSVKEENFDDLQTLCEGRRGRLRLLYARYRSTLSFTP